MSEKVLLTDTFEQTSVIFGNFDANVQMILEPLGGGGNTATAGAQIKDTSVDAVLDQLKQSIDQFFEE